MSEDAVPEVEPAEVGRIIEPGNVMIKLEDLGITLQAAMLLDKDGNETVILFDTVAVLARHEDHGWYEITLADNSWELPTIH